MHNVSPFSTSLIPLQDLLASDRSSQLPAGSTSSLSFLVRLSQLLSLWMMSLYVVSELGGKAPVIICADADLPKYVSRLPLSNRF
jgi:hypothetical protein